MIWKPLMFSTEMVRAIREGRKTQTRRVVKNPDYYACLTGDCPHDKQSQCANEMALLSPHPPGSGIWVKETWADAGIFYHEHSNDPPEVVAYKADLSAIYMSERSIPPADIATWNWDKVKWRSAMLMPRWAARTLLMVESVKVEQLNDISYADMEAEGIGGDSDGLREKKFQVLWDSINGKTYPWSSNPWVWAYTFRPLTLEQATENGWRAG